MPSSEESFENPLGGLDRTERGALVLAVDTMVATDDAHSPEIHAALLRLAEKLPLLNEAALASGSAKETQRIIQEAERWAAVPRCRECEVELGEDHSGGCPDTQPVVDPPAEEEG